MRNILHNPRCVRSLLVISLLSFVICLPLLSQPFGLSFAWKTPVVDNDPEEVAGETSFIDILAEPTYELVFIDEIYDRSYNGDETESPETEPDDVDTDVNEGSADPDPMSGIGGYFSVADLSPAPEPVYEPADYILYINANTLNLRAAPSTDSEILSKLEFGDKVNCIAASSEWMHVTSGDLKGYLKTEYTSKTMVFESVKQTVYVDSGKLNLRREPTTDSKIITVLSHLQKLTRTGIGDGWSRVRTAAGKTGYVATKYLTTKAPPTATSSGINGPTYPGDAGKIVDLAYSALGVRYVHCGSSMSGFDCSGLTSWAYRQIGITIPRSTSGYYSVGAQVSYSDIQPADILCMDTKEYDGKTSITHVGIYVGNGMMIHASSTKGKVVLQNCQEYFRWGVKLLSVRRILD